MTASPRTARARITKAKADRLARQLARAAKIRKGRVG